MEHFKYHSVPLLTHLVGYVMERQQVTAKILTRETEDLLNKQIQMEGSSSAAYLSMASWCEMTGYENSAKFLYMHSDEERGHMLKLFHYINEAGGHAFSPRSRKLSIISPL